MSNKYSFSNVIKPGLERISALLKFLGDPQDRLSFVHIAGTNGKGSVCAYIESALIHSGMRVGKYTSPNLVKVNERICVNGCDIDDESLEALLVHVESYSSAVLEMTGDKPSPFEIWTAAAMLWFDSQKCDIIVLETGLGGEFDATNVIKTCKLAVLCHIELDHTEYLGDTLEKIARTKCGIIRKDIGTNTVVSAVQAKKAADVIADECEKYSHRLVVASNYDVSDFEKIYETVDFENIGRVRLALGGVYQISNASLAVSALEVLGISKEDIRYGLENAAHRARFELIDDGLIFDGAHNPDGVRSLEMSLVRYFGDSEITFVYATMKDKDISGTLPVLNGKNRNFVFTTVDDNPRAMPSETLCRLAYDKFGIRGEFSDDFKEALALARKKGGIVVICGSLYLYSSLY